MKSIILGSIGIFFALAGIFLAVLHLININVLTGIWVVPALCGLGILLIRLSRK